MKSVDVRKRLTDALRLDLIGPEENLGSAEEVLPEARHPAARESERRTRAQQP